MSIVTLIKDYKYSSWCEYDGTVEPVFQICNTQTVLNRIPFNDFNGWVNDPLPDVANFLDNQGDISLALDFGTRRSAVCPYSLCAHTDKQV